MFVEDHRAVQVAVAIGSGIDKDVHLHSPRLAVRRRGKVGVVKPAAVLGVGLDGVIAETAATKVVILEIAGGFREAQFVKPIVIKITPIEQLHHGSVRIGDRLSRQVQREVKDAIGGGRARQVRTIIGIQVRVCIDIIAFGLSVIVIDPPVRRSVGRKGAEREQIALNRSSLSRARNR